MSRPRRISEPVEIIERMEGTLEEVKVVKPLGEALCDLLAYGHDPEDACEEVGLTPRSYYYWRQQGGDAAAILAEGGRELTESEDECLQFLQTSNRARKSLQRKLERRIHDLVPTMETREVTDVLARLAKVKWSKASSMKLDVNGEVTVVEQHGQAVGRMIRLVVDGLVAAAPNERVRQSLRDAAPGIVQGALAEVVAPAKERKELTR